MQTVSAINADGRAIPDRLEDARKREQDGLAIVDAADLAVGRLMLCTDVWATLSIDAVRSLIGRCLNASPIRFSRRLFVRRDGVKSARVFRNKLK